MAPSLATRSEERLDAIFEEGRLLAEANRLGFVEAGRDAMVKGLIDAADWT